MEINWKRGVKMLEDGSSHEAMFELVESSLAGREPVKMLALVEERGNWRGNTGIAVDKMMIEISETKEDLDFLN